MLSLLSVFGKSSRVFVSGPHIQRSPRSDLRFALTKSLFCCVFGLMEERAELPKQLSRRTKPGVQRVTQKRRSWAILDASNIRRVSQNWVFKRNQLPRFNPSLNTKMYFIVLRKGIFLKPFKGAHPVLTEFSYFRAYPLPAGPNRSPP